MGSSKEIGIYVPTNVRTATRVQMVQIISGFHRFNLGPVSRAAIDKLPLLRVNSTQRAKKSIPHDGCPCMLTLQHDAIFPDTDGASMKSLKILSRDILRRSGCIMQRPPFYRYVFHRLMHYALYNVFVS